MQFEAQDLRVMDLFCKKHKSVEAFRNSFVTPDPVINVDMSSELLRVMGFHFVSTRESKPREDIQFPLFQYFPPFYMSFNVSHSVLTPDL